MFKKVAVILILLVSLSTTCFAEEIAKWIYSDSKMNYGIMPGTIHYMEEKGDVSFVMLFHKIGENAIVASTVAVSTKRHAWKYYDHAVFNLNGDLLKHDPKGSEYYEPKTKGAISYKKGSGIDYCVSYIINNNLPECYPAEEEGTEQNDD